jgi:biopolymer transport protein ExbD
MMAVSLALREPQPMIEMNMTPLVDVLLVLIIMFIITVPIQSHAVKLDLPRGNPLPTDSRHNLLTITPDGVARWNGVAADDSTLMATLRASEAMRPQPELHLKPDAEARYQRVDEVLAMTKRADITRMGFVDNERYQRF